MARVLLVDDDAESLWSLARALKAAGLAAAIDAASNVEKACEYLQQDPPQVVVLDLSLDPVSGVESGFALLRRILGEIPFCRVIVLTGHGSNHYGMRALELGAANFLQKPADVLHLCALARDGIAQAELKREHLRVLAEAAIAAGARLAGGSEAIAKVREQVRYAAGTLQPVLIVGETGTGKGVCAQEIHRLGPRAGANFIRYQPSFGSFDLVNSDLFGHVKGAFTGAAEARRGLIIEAHKGTLFLDEVDQLPAETQVVLLGVLQDKAVRALGADRDAPSDFRLLCASNADIEKSMNQGALRRDFYHRIAHYTIELPPLRARRGDVEALAQQVLARLRDRERVNVVAIDAGALRRLQLHDWPGNVRELEAAVAGAAYHAQFCGRVQIVEEDLFLQRNGRGDSPAGAPYAQKVEHFKLELIRNAIAACGGNQVKAAQLLGLDRSSMRRILMRSKDS